MFGKKKQALTLQQIWQLHQQELPVSVDAFADRIRLQYQRCPSKETIVRYISSQLCQSFKDIEVW